MIWIETDLEPDDVFALLLLPLAEFYVVGEGNARIKYNRMIEYVKLLKETKKDKIEPILIQGIGSMKDFSLDGKEFDGLANNNCTENYLKQFIKFANSKNPVMFSFKPMRELLAEYIKNPELIKSLVSEVILYVYGGFNFRCLFNEKQKLLDLLHCFNKVYIYETFFVLGENNSMNKKNSNRLYKYIIEHPNKYFETMFKLTYNWNKNIINDMAESLKNPNLDHSTRNQHRKVIDNVIGNEDFQFVVADFGLAIVYEKIKPYPISNLRFENYTIFDWSDKPTNMYAYKDISIKHIEELILNYLQKHLN